MHADGQPFQVPGFRSAYLLILVAGMCVPAIAQTPSSAQAAAIREKCRGDYQAHCAGVPTGGTAALACLQQHAGEASPACRQALLAVSKSATPAPAAAAPQAAVTPQAAATAPNAAIAQWPHTLVGANGTATVYQPQIISWPDRQTLNTRIAVGFTPTGAKVPILGTIEVTFATETDLATRSVLVHDPQLKSSRFPMANTDEALRFEERIKAALAGMGAKRVPLDTVLLSLPALEKPAEVPLKNDPPVIFVSAGPASLVVFDGEPVLAPVAQTGLSIAVNTNWDVFFDAATKAWYLRVNGGWITAAAIDGPWSPVRRLPEAFASLPNDANFAEVKKEIPGRTIAARDMPTIFVSKVPAEIIATYGPPTFNAVPGTSLQYVANSDAAVFRDTANGQFYYLVSGRWFAAPALTGPWTFATNRLPADFMRIPANGPRGFVRASVPGTPEAEQALIETQIPQQASLDRSTAKIEVVYAGAPKFEPVAGTGILYAVNTSYDVLRVGDVYFACWQGAWFTAPTPAGPWTLATSVPAAIYAIPPSSPLYRLTYVKVYAVTPTYVTYGYTSGYTMAYVSSGVVVYGTGWYYPPVIIAGPIPIYYPYPYSYAGAVYYNAATGAWARGGAIYGPYGGVVKGGTAYNPATGAWAHGGTVYGPNGGAGAFSAYNPSTGSYAHGSAVWGPGGGTANANWYNARTGISGSTNQNSNAYGRWGSSTFSGPNQTVHTQSQSNAQGSAGSFSSSSGAKGAGVKGAGGNSAGAVKTAGGDVYAGADGNVYKKTDSGWEKYDNGSWNSVNKSNAQNRAGNTTDAQGSQRPATSSQNLSGATQNRNAGGSHFEGAGQLDQDRNARSMGAARQQQWSGHGSMGGGGGFAGRGGGGRR